MRRLGGRPAAIDGYALADAVAYGPASALLRVRGLRGRDVALKVFRLSGTREEQESTRALLHAGWRVWSELPHAHVLPVADYGAGNDSAYVATQWLDGPSLRGVLDEQRTLDAEQVRPLAKQLAGALDAAAAAGLVHLDVKPENVLFASDGTEHAYVRDFGAGQVAAWQAGVGRSGAFGGTLEYAAPEQIEGDAVDGRTLVYALGCLLYETLTGATPYAGRSSAALMLAHVEEAPPPVGSGAAVDRVFATALAKRRDERYATCAAFADALDATLAAAPALRPARGRRRPILGLRAATVVAFLAFVAAAVATAASWLTQGAPGAPDAAADKPFSTSAFMASLPKADPTVKAAHKQIRVAPTVTRVSTRKVATHKPPRRVAPTSLASVTTGTASTSTTGTSTTATPSPAPPASTPRASSRPETTTATTPPEPPLPPPPPSTPPPQDSAPPLPPPPP